MGVGIITVSRLNRIIKDILDGSLLLKKVLVRGEISNYRPNHTGHLYFSIKDESALVDCVMFKSYASRLKFEPENGMKIVVSGSVSLYEKTGRYQIYLTDIKPDGAGELYLAFEQTKAKLESEGLFDEARKKSLPVIPGMVGVITSPTGAVIQDIISVALSRFPNACLEIIPVPVQGREAAGKIAEAVNIFNCREIPPDVIIIARGGGSFEDLFPFSEEIVARSAANSEIPIVSAVGHETDYSILDFVSDVRAPTPSAAAEIVFPDKFYLKNDLTYRNSRLINALNGIITKKKQQLDNFRSSPCFRLPYRRVVEEHKELAGLYNELTSSVMRLAGNNKSVLQTKAAALDALSPLAVLTRGYGIIEEIDSGRVIASAEAVNPGERINITMQDGKVMCRVEERYLGKAGS